MYIVCAPPGQWPPYSSGCLSNDVCTGRSPPPGGFPPDPHPMARSIQSCVMYALEAQHFHSDWKTCESPSGNSTRYHCGRTLLDCRHFRSSPEIPAFVLLAFTRQPTLLKAETYLYTSQYPLWLSRSTQAPFASSPVLVHATDPGMLREIRKKGRANDTCYSRHCICCQPRL